MRSGALTNRFQSEDVIVGGFTVFIHSCAEILGEVYKWTVGLPILNGTAVLFWIDFASLYDVFFHA